MKYKIITNLKDKINIKYEKQLTTVLAKHTKVNKDFEYLFIIGGDGTFLKETNKYLMKKIKIIFINSGTLGFYSYTSRVTEIKINEILSEQNYINLDLLEVNHKDAVWYCINDFAYHSNYSSEIKLFINNVLLETIKGNGMLVTTPMGSTARNKSLKGAILMPNTNVLSIVEVEAINNRVYSSLVNPIVINNDNKIRFETTNYRNSSLILDGNVIECNDSESIIDISHRKSEAKVLIKTSDSEWVKKLNRSFK